MLAAAAAIAGCAGQPAANPSVPAQSWMLKEAASEELVYVSDQGQYNDTGIYVYSYPQGKQVGFLQDDIDEVYEGLCADAHGDVWAVGWITNRQAFFDEYAHGGSQPIASIGANGVPSGCSVDPTTGNLAVANYIDYNTNPRRGDIAIYPKGSQTPKVYYDDSIKYYYYCAYDDDGNLYADGNTNYVNVLAKNSTTLRHVYFNKAIVPGSLQWNSGSLATAVVGGSKGPVRIDRVTVQGSGARITGTTSLETTPSWGNYLDVEIAIAGKVIAGPGPNAAGPSKALYFWAYPTGGKASKTIVAPNNSNFYGVAFSP
jgi:hypothetical protein